jgi:hypothetical protein
VLHSFFCIQRGEALESQPGGPFLCVCAFVARFS